MKKKLLTLLIVVFGMSCSAAAQKRTTMPTFYKNYRSAVITFSDGHKSKNAFTNVFLKNGSLLFLKGEQAMEANMSNIVAVDFDDRSFVAIDRKLAYLVDSVGSNALYCIELFDKDTYERNLKNNVNISNLDFSADMVNTTTVDLNGEDDFKMPVFRHYYYLYNGEFVRVHEREIARHLKKEKRTMMKRIMALPDFSWVDVNSLIQLLKAISD